MASNGQGKLVVVYSPKHVTERKVRKTRPGAKRINLATTARNRDNAREARREAVHLAHAYGEGTLVEVYGGPALTTLERQLVLRRNPGTNRLKAMEEEV